MQEMKDSGIEWVSKIPIGWKVARLKDVIQMLTDYTANGSFGDLAKNVQYLDYEDYARLIRLTDLRENLENSGVYVSEYSYDYLEKSSLYGGEILVANVGAYAGLFCEMPPINMPSTLGPNMFLIRTNSQMIQHYLYYLGNADFVWKQLVQKAMSSAQPKLNKTDVNTTYIIVPPLQEQQRIADFLDAKCAEIDALTADIQTQIDTLEQYKRSVITETITKGLNPDAEMKDSGIEWVGEIPAHWLVHPVYYYYGERKNKNYLGKEDNLLSLSYGRVVRKDINTSDGLLPESFNTYNIVETGDIIIRPTDLQNDKRSLRTGLVKEHGIITSAYIDLCPIKQVDSRYFYFLLHAYDVMKVFYNMGNGVRQGLNYSEFSRLMVFEPPYEEQVAIADYLETKVIEVDAIIERKKEQMSVLNAYKRSLIFEYVTGKKEVRNETADAIVALNPHIILLGIINDRIGKKHTRGKVQLQKLLYLLDIHVGMNVNTKYYRYEHGPYDRQLNCYIDVLIKNRWYEQRHDNGEILIKGKNHDEFVRKYKNQFREKQMEINQLIDALRDMKTSQLERIATLYAVWNDFILEGESHPTDEKILHEVVTNWTANKANPQDGTWKLSLEKMKKLGIIPTGKGLHTSRKPMRKAENE